MLIETLLPEAYAGSPMQNNTGKTSNNLILDKNLPDEVEKQFPIYYKVSLFVSHKIELP
jgi:hypothetical protein